MTRRPWDDPGYSPPGFALPHRMDQGRLAYIRVLLRALERRLDDAGELDEKLADRIELLMHTFWPNDFPTPAGVNPVEAPSIKPEPRKATLMLPVYVGNVKSGRIADAVSAALLDAGIEVDRIEVGMPRPDGVSASDHQTFSQKPPMEDSNA